MKNIFFGIFISIILFSVLNILSFADDGGQGMLNGEYHFQGLDNDSRFTNIKVHVTMGGLPTPENRFLFVVNNGRVWVMSESYILDGSDSQGFGWTQSCTWTENNEDKSTSAIVDHSGPISGIFGDYLHFIGFSISTNALFDSPASALAYLTDGDESGLIGGYVPAPINWGGNDPEDRNQPDTDNIPSPKVEIVKDGNGNHSIKFTNQIYNYSDHGVYGLVLKGNWDSFDTFTMSWKNALSNEYKIYYDNLLGDNVIFTMYDVPGNVDQIVRCPATINFETQTQSVNAFNSFLSRNPVLNRSITFQNGATDANNTASMKFRSYLSGISCPYNTCVFSCFYYRQMSDGTYHYGPSYTGSFSVPQQGATYNYSNNVVDPDPGIIDPNPIIIPGPTPGPNPSPIIDPGNSDPSDLYENMQGLLGFIGEVPQLVGQIFTFLPQWLIVFLAAAIGLMIAIGVVKLFLG